MAIQAKMNNRYDIESIYFNLSLILDGMTQFPYCSWSAVWKLGHSIQFKLKVEIYTFKVIAVVHFACITITGVL